MGLAVLGAQGGHLLAYRLRFGAAAQQLQSTGAHSYFPTAVKAALGTAALVAIGALLVIGLARVVAAGVSVPRRRGPSFVTILAALFSLQLTWFFGQEIVEALVAGVPPDSTANLLLWGIVGQLPVAVAGAAVLSWLGSRVESAVAQIAAVAHVSVPAAAVRLAPAPVPARPGERALAVAHAARSRIVKRGPPLSSAFRPF